VVRTKKAATSATSLPVRRWNAMTPEQQLAAVREVCGSKGSALVKRFDDVIAVGAGFKKSDGAVSTYVCLGLMVKKKKKYLANVSKPIPERLMVTVLRNDKPVRLSVPTDVEELGMGKPHQGVNTAAGVRAFNRSNPTQGVPGAACCIVIDESDATNRFILGCHHVLALSLLTSGCAFFKDTDVSGRGTVPKFGGLFHPLPMTADGDPCLDAALSLVDSGVEVSWESSDGIKPVRVEPGVKQPLNCFVFTPNGPLAAAFVKEWANIPLQYARCGTVVIAAAYQFQASTQGGHSGSPVMTTDGTLHGMHFWGDEQQQLSMAIPAFMLFRPGLFPVNFKLVAGS